MRDGRRVTVDVTAAGAGLVSHARSALLAGSRQAGALFGPVASDSTAFRVIDRIATGRVSVCEPTQLGA